MRVNVLKYFAFLALVFAINAVTAQEKTSTEAGEKLLMQSGIDNATRLENTDREAKVNNTPKTNLLSSEKGINTYEVYNETLRRDLFYNKEKRDMLTALPGFIELGVSSENAPMRVVIAEQYATEYLTKYFKTN